jgi:hypothetical protein
VNSRYELPPLSEGTKGEINWFGWMLTVNFPDMSERFEEKQGLRLESEVPLDYLDFSSTITHEGIHFIQALTASYMYRSACHLWHRVQEVIQKVRLFPSDTVITLPLQIESSIGSLLTQMRTKSSTLSTPDVLGVSALDVMEGATVFITHRMQLENMNNHGYLQRIEEQYSVGNLRTYSDAYRLAEWYLGDDIFDIFSVICFLALCSEEPGEMFCHYVRAIGRSGILHDHKRLTVQEIIDLGIAFGVTELKTTVQEINTSGLWHPILFPHVKKVVENLPKGFNLVEFAARPYECEDVEIFRLMRPPLLRFHGKIGNIAPDLPNFFSNAPTPLQEVTDKDNANLIVTLTAICGAVLAMLWPDDYYMHCPHTNCPYYGLRLCHTYAPVPPRYQECGFIERFELVFEHPLSIVQFKKDGE